jgi:GH25 family lysozyme M1 (1,4-beta-N-acetylmuramidase)
MRGRIFSQLAGHVIWPGRITLHGVILVRDKENGNRIMALTHGIDVSNYNDVINWNALRGKIDFAFIKATEGTGFTDPMFSYNWSEAKKIGVHRFAYHFAHPATPPGDQAEFFVNTVKSHGFKAGDNLAYDVEISQGLTPHAIDVWTKDAVTRAKSLEKSHRVLVYTYPAFAEGGTFASMGDYYLWIANYGVAEPSVPSPWKNWIFWQYFAPQTATPTDFDLDVFRGTPEQLTKFCTSTGKFNF